MDAQVRIDAARALAKAIAYSDSGRADDAQRWVNELNRILEAAGVGVDRAGTAPRGPFPIISREAYLADRAT